MPYDTSSTVSKFVGDSTFARTDEGLTGPFRAGFLVGMQILASALPGFRDLRAPLTAGYMWLLFVYLLVRPDVGTRPHSPIGAALFDLAADVGRVWVALGVSTAAYLVGAMSTGVSEWLLGQPYRLATRWAHEAEIEQTINDEEGSDRPEVLRGANAAVLAQFERIRQHGTRVNMDVDRVFAQAVLETNQEPNLPATVLVDDKPTLFAEVDRLRSEGDLRLAVAVPLTALSLLLVAVASPWWLLALIGVAILVVQGNNRRGQSRQLIVDAIQQGRIESPALARLSALVDEAVRM